MKKLLTILIVLIAIMLALFFGWYLFLRDTSIPVEEAILDILPFGSGGDFNIPALLPGNTDTISNELPVVDRYSSPTSNLFRISAAPVAGLVVFKKGSSEIVRFMDRATGHIYDVSLSIGTSSTPLEKIKVTNTTLPKIYEAYFKPDGASVLIRSLKDDTDVVENVSLTLTPPKATSTLYTISSTALRGDIGAVAVGLGNTLFYALRDTSSIISSAFNGTGAKTLLTSAFSDWGLVPAGSNLVVYTKPSSSAPGYAYTLNASTRAFAKILGPLNGLVAVPNVAGNRVLYSFTDGGRTRLSAKNLSNNKISEMSPVTLADKCVWSIKKAPIVLCGAPVDGLNFGEPDNWYMGLTHFSDRIWLFDTNIDIAQVLIEPKQVMDIDIDISQPRLSPDEDYLIFINKNDLSLWALRLEKF